MDERISTAPTGRVVGDRYRIESLIGRGGMASVYRAHDELLGRAVALKIITPAASDASAVRRARSEIELLASMNHHALVTLFDAGADDVDGVDHPYLVMELVDGPTLGARIEQGPLAPADVCRMAVDLAEGLGAVHARGVVHRDVKPGNVLLSQSTLPTHEFTAKLADFGIAHLVDSTRLTVAGGLIGTAAYLSPEQARGADPAPASDVYSLGLVLLEALTRTRAFPGALVESVGVRLVTGPPIPASLGPGWTSLLSAMTAMSPDDRPRAIDVAAIARQLESDLSGPGAPAGPDLGTHVRSVPPVPAAPATAATSATATITRRLDEPASGSTSVMPAALAAALNSDNTPRRTGEHVATVRRHEDRPRSPLGRRIAAGAGVLVAVVVAFATIPPLVSPRAPDVPDLPAVVEPLASDLDALMASVTP